MISQSRTKWATVLLLHCLVLFLGLAKQGGATEYSAAPNIINGSFESESVGDNKTDLSGWQVVGGDVDVMDTVNNKQVPPVAIGASDGSKFLDLANGTITQNVAGFVPNQTYVMRLDYWGHPAGGFGTLADVKVIVAGQELKQGLFGGDFPGIHSKEETDWLVCSEFEFVATSSIITIRLEAEDGGQNGLLIDNVRFEQRSKTQPAAHDFSSLAVDSDGWSRLANWSFETPIGDYNSDPENTGPDNNNPHLCGNSIPSWRVTRENTDRIQGGAWNPPNGTKVMDVGGHGPGGIGQTISGLAPNGSYTLEFYAARHRFWGSDDMVTHLWSNGAFKLEVKRTTAQDAEDGYIREEVDLTADGDGKIIFELFSMNIDKGGNNVFDSFRLIKKQDPPVVTAPADQADNLGTAITPLMIEASDLDDDDLTFAAEGLPTGLDINGSSGVISGTLTAAGTFDVTVTVDDGNGNQDTAEFSWVVNTVPQISGVANQLMLLGERPNLTITASDADNDPLSFSAAGLPAGLAINTVTGQISGTLTAAGDYSVTVAVDDGRSGTSSVSFDWIVNTRPVLIPPSDQKNEVGQTVTLNVTASDADGNSFTFGAVTLPAGIEIDEASGQLTGTLAESDQTTAEIFVQDEHGAKHSVTFDWEVYAQSPPLSEGEQIFLPLVVR